MSPAKDQRQTAQEGALAYRAMKAQQREQGVKAPGEPSREGPKQERKRDGPEIDMD